MLLSQAIVEKTRLSEEEAKTRLLNQMDRTKKPYKASIEANAIEPNSWAAITICYGTSNPQYFIDKLKGGDA